METTPDRIPEPDRDLVDAEADAAAAQAARIGGLAGDEDLDPAERPLAEAGEGDAEGFELAEADLIENAEHAEGIHSPGAPEAESDRASAAYGEADHVEHPEQRPPLEGDEGGINEDRAGG